MHTIPPMVFTVPPIGGITLLGDWLKWNIKRILYIVIIELVREMIV